MINSAALLPSLSRSSGLSPRSAIGLNIIRRDSIAVDSLLKERLVLSKIRYGIERQEQERERRRNREADLEADSKQNYEVGDAPNNPRKRRRGIGGLLGTVFGGILSSLGGVAFQAAPAFLLARSNVLKGGVNFNRTIGATGGLLNTIKGQRGRFDTLKKVKLDPVKNIGRTITRFGNSLTFFVNSAIAGQVAGRALSATRTPAQVKARVAQQARIKQRATSGVRTKSKAGVRAGQIDIEEALELRRSQENARAMSRVNAMRRQREIQAEAAAEVTKRKRKKVSRKVTAERAFKRETSKIVKSFVEVEIPVGAAAGGSRKGRAASKFISGSFDMGDAEKKFIRKKRLTKIGKNKFKKPIFTIDGVTFEFEADLMMKSGQFADNYVPPKGSPLSGMNYKPQQARISMFFADANEVSRKSLSNRLVSPENMNFMAQDILDADDLSSPFYKKQLNFYKVQFEQIERARLNSEKVFSRSRRAPIRPEGDMTFGRPTGFDQQGKPLFKARGPKGMRRSDVTSSGRVGSKVFRKPDGTVVFRSGGLTNADLLFNAGQKSTQNMFRDLPTQIRNVDLLKDAGEKSTKKIFKDIDKVKSQKVIPKKGIGKFLGNIGGSQFLKPVKEFIGQGVKNIPFIGDLIGILLDVFVFGEPIQRALFLAGGSALGGFLGGLAGSIGGPPGILIGGIIGGIAGDLLGGAFYDLLFRRGQRGSVGQRFGASATKASIKAGLFTGGFAGYGSYLLGEGGREFVLDADSTAALERRSPGFLMALNKARGAQAIGVIEDYASYDKTSTGKERMIPIPIPTPQNDSSSQNIMTTDSEVEGGTGGGFITFLSDHYRRA